MSHLHQNIGLIGKIDHNLNPYRTKISLNPASPEPYCGEFIK